MPQSDVDQWAAAGAASLQQTQAEQLRASVGQALPVNPDKEAELRRYASVAAVPIETARAMPDQTRVQAQMSQFDPTALQQKFPATARWLATPANAAIAHDDVPATTAVEQAVKALAPAPSKPITLGDMADYVVGNTPSNGLIGDVGAGFGAMFKGLGGSFNAAGAAVNIVAGAAPTVYDKLAGGTSASDWWFRNAVDPLVRQQQAFDMAPDAPFAMKAVHTAGSLLGTMSQIVLSGAGGEVPPALTTIGGAVKAAVEHGVKAMAFPALADSVNMGRKVFDATGGDAAAALNAAGAQWFSTSAAGVMPLSAPGGLATRLAGGALAGGATGEVTRQGMNLAMPEKMQTPFEWESVFLSMLSGSILAGAMGPHGEGRSLLPAIRETYTEAYQKAQAEGQTQRLMEVAKAATASKLRERDPEAFRQFVKDAAEDGNLPGVFIEAHQLAQVLQDAGIPGNELRQKMPEVARQLDAALGENTPKNGLVSIPIEDFATHIAGGPVQDALMQHLRVTPEGSTLGESKAFVQSQAEDFQARADKLSETNAADEAYKASLHKVSADLQTRLEAIGMRQEQAAANLAPLLAFYQVHADQMGLHPHEFAEMYPVQFSRQAGEGYGQAAAVRAEPTGVMSPITRKPVFDLFSADGQKVATMHSADTAASAVQIHNKAAEMPAAPPPPVRVEAPPKDRGGSTTNWRIVKGQQFTSLDEGDGYLYHVTSAPAAREIIKTGLVPGNGEMFGGGYAGHSAGRVFLTDRAGVSFWKERVEQQLQHGSDKPPAVSVVRIPKSSVTAELHADSAGTTDARAPAFYVEGATLRQDASAAPARGTFSPSTKTISLLKGADLSTFQHELGHYFLDVTAHLAAMRDAPPSVVKDVQTLLKWFGVEDLNTWHRMGLDEQRASHEQFATGWETYLMKGQAPTLELRTVFQRFRSWMLTVYRGLKGAPGEFTPEVAGVFDRMIASEAAIHEAELARKYMPLFDSPEKAGMSAEEWSAYQAQGKDATEQAIEQLIGKTMKDMAWTDRLRTASLKSVQKDAAEKRKVIVREVRAEVMSQPVYRAWAFLTGRDSAALPDEVNAEHKQAVRDWSEKRGEFEATTKADTRLKAWEASGVAVPEGKNPGLVKGQWLAKNRARIDLDVQRAMLDYDAEHPKPKAPEKADGQSKDATTGAGKLNLAALKEAHPEQVKALQDRKMASGKGMEPGVVADMFGFANADELVRALADADHPREVVQGMTDQRMLERHGELVDDAAMRATADALVQNEVRAKFVATELRALKKATGKPKDMVAAAKEVAANTIGTKRIRDINAHQFDVAETRSAGQAEKAMTKGDTEGAAAAKRDQLLNIELGRAARDAKDFVAKALTYLAKFDKASTREAIDLEYRDQIDALLARADLRKSVSGTALDKREALLSFVERMAGQGYQPAIPEHLLDEAQQWHYKDMPLEAFKGLVEAVKSIEHLGKLKTTLRDLQETRAINDLADEVKASAAKLPQRGAESNRGLTRMQSAWLSVKAAGRSAQASMLKMEQMFDWLDARNSNGALNRVVFRRLADAGTMENNLLARVKADIDGLIETHLADVTKDKKIYTATGLIDKATGKVQRFTTKEMLMLAGNMGNESNAAKMAKGEGWDQAAVWAFLNANMTKAHWDYVAGMGRVLESLWPEKLAMDRRLGNTSPEKIEPRPFDTPHGRYSGWYWPLMYDPARSQDVAERGARQGDALFENIYSRANTDTGRMNTRNEHYARPLLLDLDALPRMLKDEIHDISHREAVIDADRFLAHPTVRTAIIDALSQEHYDQLRPWLQSIANDGKLSSDGGRGMEFFNAVAREARTRATIVGLGFRLTTAMVHGMSAGAESVSELGAKWMGSGLKDFANPGQWTANRDFIFERSGEMRNRMNEVDRDVREHLREIDLHLMDPASSAMSRGADLMKAHAYSMIAGLDMASALPTWMGAYKKAMTPIDRGGLGLGEKDAVYFADKTVRNAHGGTGIKDMARVQRGSEFQKLFTMFYTFWNHNVNRIIDTSKLVTSPEHRAAMKEANHWSTTQLASTVIMRTLVYTLGVQVLHSLVHPPAEGADEESWLKWAAKEMTAAAFAGIPIARDLSAHYLGGRDYKVTPAASIVDAVGKTGTDLAHVLTGEQVSDKWLKHTINTAGFAAGLPTGQLGGTAQFLWDVGHGAQHPEGVKDWWNGLLHGDTHSH